MASWQTRAVRLYLRATRKKRYRTVEAGRHSMANGLPAAPLPTDLADRSEVTPLGGGEVRDEHPVLRLDAVHEGTAVQVDERARTRGAVADGPHRHHVAAPERSDLAAVGQVAR